MASTAKLGFHQYKLDLNVHKKSVSFHDADEDQIKDTALFKSRGIDSLFLEKIFDASSENMWFPTHDELVSAKFVNKIIHTKIMKTQN